MQKELWNIKFKNKTFKRKNRLIMECQSPDRLKGVFKKTYRVMMACQNVERIIDFKF